MPSVQVAQYHVLLGAVVGALTAIVAVINVEPVTDVNALGSFMSSPRHRQSMERCRTLLCVVFAHPSSCPSTSAPRQTTSAWRAFPRSRLALPLTIRNMHSRRARKQPWLRRPSACLSSRRTSGGRLHEVAQEKRGMLADHADRAARRPPLCLRVAFGRRHTPQTEPGQSSAIQDSFP